MQNIKNYKLIGIILIVCTGVLNIGGTWISNRVIQRSNRIYEGISIVLDAGHGGKDKGAQYNGIYESDINLNIVKELKKQLEEIGMNVILTRNDDYDLANANSKIRKSEDLKQRMKIINRKEIDLYISIHMNAYVNKEVKGYQIFYKKEDHNSKVFADYIQNSLYKFTNIKNETKEGNYYILNNTDKIGILLECGFLSNEEDRNNFIEESYRKQFVLEIRNGIIAFLKDIYE